MTTRYDLVTCCMQVGFVIALAAEAAVPVRGLFGAWDQQTLSLLWRQRIVPHFMCGGVHPFPFLMPYVQS